MNGEAVDERGQLEWIDPVNWIHMCEVTKRCDKRDQLRGREEEDYGGARENDRNKEWRVLEEQLTENIWMQRTVVCTNRRGVGWRREVLSTGQGWRDGRQGSWHAGRVGMEQI